MRKDSVGLYPGQAVEVIGSDGSVIYTGTLTYFKGHWVGVAGEQGTSSFLAHWVRAAGASLGADRFYGMVR